MGFESLRGSGGAGGGRPTPTLLTDLLGATLVDPNTLDGGSSGFNPVTGEFRVNMAAANPQTDGFRDGTLHWAIPLNGASGLHPGLDFDAGDILYVVVAAPGWGPVSANQGVAIAVLNENTTDSGTVEGSGFSFVRVIAQYRFGWQNTANGLFSDQTLNGDETHLQVTWRSLANPTNGPDLENMRASTRDNGTNWTVNGPQAIGNVSGTNRWLVVQGITTGANALEIDVTFKLYTFILPGPGSDYSALT